MSFGPIVGFPKERDCVGGCYFPIPFKHEYSFYYSAVARVMCEGLHFFCLLMNLYPEVVV